MPVTAGASGPDPVPAPAARPVTAAYAEARRCREALGVLGRAGQGRLLGPDWQTPARALEIQLALRLHQLSAAVARDTEE